MAAHEAIAVYDLYLPGSSIPASVLQVVVPVIVVTDVWIAVRIQGQGGVLADIPHAVHGLDVPAGGVLVGILQVAASVVVVADVGVAGGVQG